MNSLSGSYKEIRKSAEPFLQTRDNDQHTTLATEFAFELLEQEGGDEDVVIPAIILHDTGWIKVPEKEQLKAFGPNANAPETTRYHERESVKIARNILEKIGYDKGKTPEIIKIIERHDSRLEAISLNDKIVKDADKLTRYHPDMLSSWAKRLKLDMPEDAFKGLRESIDVWFFTETAKDLANKNIQEMLEETPKP